MNPTPESQREKLWGLLGDLPPRHRRLSARVVQETETPEYRLRRLVLNLNGFEPVPAVLVLPLHVSGKAPAVLYSHAHGGDYALGKEEFIRSRGFLQDPPYAREIAARGWVGLAIDAWTFGERNQLEESSLFKHMLWHGRVLWGMMVYDTIRALDYLVSLPEVDETRVATLGMSMGSTMAWWVAALDPRVKVCVDLCCLTDFNTLIEQDGLDWHGLYYYVPGLLNHFSTATINELIAPRPHLSLAGIHDRLTPPKGLDRINNHLRLVYEEKGAPEAWKLFRSDSGHQETPEMRDEVLIWLTRWL